MADIDTMGYSEEELERIASGGAPAVDTMGYSEEELAQIANQPPEDPGFGANPPGKEPWFKAGPLEVARNPLDVDWIAAAKDKWNDSNPSALAGIENPLLAEAAAPAIGSALSKTGRFIRGLVKAPRIPTPPPQIVSTGVSSGGGILPSAPTFAPQASVVQPKSLLDQGINAAKWAEDKLQYVPFGGEAQRVTKGVQDAGKGIKNLLEHAPEAFGKFANILRIAAAQSPGGLATTDFLMSQSNPEYQEIKKKLMQQ